MSSCRRYRGKRKGKVGEVVENSCKESGEKRRIRLQKVNTVHIKK